MNTTDITKRSIVKRLNEATYDLYMSEMASRMANDEMNEKHRRDAGEAISQSLEWILKLHLRRVTGTSYQEKRLFESGNISDLINGIELYGNPLNETSPEADLSFLKHNKGKLTNFAKHKGNSPADSEFLTICLEKVKEIYMSYISLDIRDLKNKDDYGKLKIAAWDAFYAACNRFEKEQRNFFLLIDKQVGAQPSSLEILGKLPWNLIIDFDTLSMESGFYKSSYSTTKPLPRVINVDQLVTEDDISSHSQSHYHYFINGYKGSQVNGFFDYYDWSKKYDRYIEKFLDIFFQKFPFKTTVVVIGNIKQKQLYFLFDKIRRHFGGTTEFVLTSENPEQDVNLNEGLTVKPIAISIQEIEQGVSSFSTNFGLENKYSVNYPMPFSRTTTGVNGELSIDVYLGLEEDFEVLHLGLPTTNSEIIEDRRDFLSGVGPISWFGLKNRFDVERPDVIKRSVKHVESLLESGKGKVNLVHEPGYGGSVLARRIAWDLHFDYPTIILKKYRGEKSMAKVRQLYDLTKKTVLVVMEVPQSITLDDVSSFYNQMLSRTRPIVFLVVRRGQATNGDLTVADWGNNYRDLRDAYYPFLREITSDVIVSAKEQEFRKILENGTSHQKTPFYTGLLTFEERFFALRDFIKKFIEAVKTDEQRRILVYLSICYDYVGEGLDSVFFSSFLSPLEEQQSIFRLELYLPNEFGAIISSTFYGRNTYWQIRHYLFAKEIKMQILRGSSLNEEIWKENLADYCIKFVEDSNKANKGTEFIQDLLQKMFIGTRKDRSGSAFTELVNDIRQEDRERVFKCLKDTYPENPHYCSHLARFYAYVQRNRELAYKYADEAIRLSMSHGFDDSLLHHIKGMCIREGANDIMEKLLEEYHRNGSFNEEEYENLLNHTIPAAGKEFEISRDIDLQQKKRDGYGFVAHIQMLIRVIDFGATLSGMSKSQFLAQRLQPFSDWLELAETLLEDVKRLNSEEDESGKITRADDELNTLYEKYDLVLQSLNNQLEKGIDLAKTRRQIVRIYARKYKDEVSYDSRIITRIIELMEANIEAEPDNEKNFYLWFQAARQSNIRIQDAISKLHRWYVNGGSMDALYYLYILKVFRALDGFTEDCIDAEKYIQEIRSRSSRIPTNTVRYEWYGKGSHLKALINRRKLKDGGDTLLKYVSGFITEYQHEGSGTITIADKLSVYFNPSQARLTADDKNKKVEFFLGFSYDGLRADSTSVKIV